MISKPEKVDLKLHGLGDCEATLSLSCGDAAGFGETPIDALEDLVACLADGLVKAQRARDFWINPALTDEEVK